MMAKTTRKCPDCGENEIKFSGRNRKDVERYADWQIEKGNVCDDCLNRRRYEENEQAKKANADAGLPILEGTEKQIGWAESIRSRIIGHLNIIESMTLALESGDQESAKELAEQLPEIWRLTGREFQGLDLKNSDQVVTATLAVCQGVRGQADAGWWIDSRDEIFCGLVREMRATIIAALNGDEDQARNVADDVAVKPESPVCDTPVTINVHESQVRASLSEKRDDFRNLIKPLGYRWAADGRFWYLTVDPTLGAVQDRAAELMRSLLDAGLIVICQRAAVREMALNSTYEPVYPRWAVIMHRGRFDGWCRLTTTDDLDISESIRQMGGREDYYRSGTWYIRPSHYAEIRDLAAMHGFRVSPGADKALDDAQKIDETRLVACDLPTKPESQAQEEPQTSPASGAIDPSLRDE